MATFPLAAPAHTNQCTDYQYLRTMPGGGGQIVSAARSGINYDPIPVPSVLYI